MAEREIVKLTLSKGFAKAVDALVEKGDYKSRPDFFEKAGHLLLEKHGMLVQSAQPPRHISDATGNRVQKVEVD
jgi:Arc/MetJ-type ribon-helix-helix transcriptional regulator